MTPEGRSRRYVQEICRRIGEDKIELGNACCGVRARGSKATRASAATAAAPRAGQEGAPEEKEEGETPAEVLVVAEEGTVSEESEEGSDGVKVKVKGKGGGSGALEDAGRWEVVDGRGRTRCFDEVRRSRRGGKARQYYRSSCCCCRLPLMLLLLQTLACRCLLGSRE